MNAEFFSAKPDIPAQLIQAVFNMLFFDIGNRYNLHFWFCLIALKGQTRQIIFCNFKTVHKKEKAYRATMITRKTKLVRLAINEILKKPIVGISWERLYWCSDGWTIQTTSRRHYSYPCLGDPNYLDKGRKGVTFDDGVYLYWSPLVPHYRGQSCLLLRISLLK